MKTFTNYAAKAKQFLNLLHGYTKGIRITAILILLLMGVSNAWAANITNISDVWMEGSMNSWANKPTNWKFSKADNNHYIGTFYISHSSTNYQFKIRCAGSGWTNGSLFAIGEYWFTSSNYDFTKNMTTSAKNDQIQCMSKPTSGYIKLDCEFWGSYDSDSRLVIKQSAVAALSPSLSASSTSLIKSRTSTITASCSGGSGSYTYTYKVTCDGSDVTNSTLSATTGASVTFTAPSVTGKKTYTITVTAKDSHALLSGLATETATKTITVEEAHNVTVSYKYGSTTIKANTTTNNVKYETASSITAPAITGYKFSSWTLGNGITNKSANTTTNPISITTKSSGTYTLTANYTEDLTSTWHIVGEPTSIFHGAAAWTAHNDNMLKKTTGASTASKGSLTIDVKTLPASNNSYQFKVLNTSGTKWYGWSTGDNYFWMNQTNTTGVYTDQNNLYFIPNALGDYKFDVDWSSTDPSLKVTFPTAYAVTFGKGTGGSSVTAKYNSTSFNSGTKVQSGKTVTFTQSASAGYTFKEWNTKSDGTGTQLSTNATYTHTVATTNTVYAIYTPNKYTVKFNPNGGTGSMVDQAFIYGTEQNLTANAFTNIGYSFNGWNTNEAGTGTKYADQASVNNLTTTNNGTVNLYAQWEEITYAITYKDQGDKEFSGTHDSGYPTQHTYNTTTTLLGATKDGYTFAGWYRDSECAGARVETLDVDVTEAITLYAKWNVASYTINFDTEGGTGGTTTELTVPFGAQLPNITIPTKADHLFLGYYDGDNGTGTQYYDASGKGLKTMPANNLTLHAKWLNSRDCIFFYNNLGWSNVYVYFYSSDKYWDDSKGTGSKKEQIFPQEGDADHKPHYYEYRGKMTKIEGTNIWYYNYSVHSDIKIYNYTSVAFTKDQQYNYEFFHKTEVVRRGDFNSNVPMFVSMKADKVTKNESSYYNYGYWMNYPTNTGYTLKIYNKVKGDGVQEWRSIPFEYSEDMMMPLTLSVSGMESGKTYGFKILRADNTWYGNSGTMTTNSSGDVGQTAWEFTKEVNDNCGLTTTAAGTYVFTLKYGKDRNSNYNYLVGVEYPASVGDYRLAYKDNTHPFHPGHLLKKRDGKDTVSFFVHHAQDLSPVIMLQEVTKIDAQTGDITWNTISTTKINGIGATGIYNFILEQSGNAATLLNTITEYTGDFYIRTDATAGGWGNFRQNSNKMTYTSYAENQDFGFNHYFVEWINAGTNVKFTIANEYSYCLSDSLNADGIVTDGNLPANANVRFGWNSKTNQLSRAYISGSSNVAERYLVLTGDDKLTDMDNQNFNIDGLHQHEAIFQDMGNWIYQLDAKAGRGASIQLTARYNGKDQTFFNTSAVALAEEGNETTYPVRFIYDFKTNNLMAAWLLENDKNHIQGGNDLNANMLLLRRHHNQAQQIQLTHKLSKVGTAYGVMTFEKDFVNDTGRSIYERALYWVSFPFDVCIRDVFGFGEYMDTWIMEYYDGEARAKNGAWVDSESYWTYITDLDYVLKAGVGYVLCLDLDKMGTGSKVFENTSEVSLYFPSAKPIGNIDVEQAVSDTLKALPCSIERDNRNIYDSNWHVIGVPRFINLDIELTNRKQGATQDDVIFYYEYDPENNDYAVAQSTGQKTFQTMQAYMVQYAGIIDWWDMATWETPQQIAARRNADAGPEKVSLNLELAQDDLTADKTFIQLQEEDATADFDMNKDLTKIINAGANIYTLVGEQGIKSAGNVMPMSECVVPVGVKVDTNGEYTFRMPDGTEGMVVELIDYYTNTRTNLLLFDYTVDLSAGTCNDRFALHIQPSKSGVTTGIEGAYPQTLPEGKGTKFLIDGKLIIRTAEGEVFDAQGKRL